MKSKAILDTNVLISGVFWKGPPFEILKTWQEQRFRLAISPPILDEYRRVLDEMMKKRPPQCSPRSLESSSFTRRWSSRFHSPNLFVLILMMTSF